MSLFDDFCSEMRSLVDNKADSKGYNDTGADGENLLFRFNDKFFPGHSLGEIVYKCVRYRSKKNPEDLVKVAAWAFLKWKHDQEQK